jgi:hypothetical protein
LLINLTSQGQLAQVEVCAKIPYDQSFVALDTPYRSERRVPGIATDVGIGEGKKRLAAQRFG